MPATALARSDRWFRRRGVSLLPLLWLLACFGVGGWLLLPTLGDASSPEHPASAAASGGVVPVSFAGGGGGELPPGLRQVAIERVEPGQRVWAYDAASDTWRACVVEEAYQRDYQGDMVAVGAGDSEVVATGNHPFWVAAGEDLEARPSVEELTEAETRGPPGMRGRWVEARDLREGDVLVRGDGSRITVSSLRAWEAATPVYNLRVAELHTYAVGELALAAHNNNCPPKGPYAPDRDLPRDKHGRPVPDTGAPHTQLGQNTGRHGRYPQAREFDEHGNPVRDVDFTDHGRPGQHTNPHEHPYIPNPTGGTRQRGPAQPTR